MELDFPHTHILPFFLGNMLAEPNGIPTPKNMFASMKKLAVKIAKSWDRMIYNLATSSSRSVFPSDLHSYSKRRFIRPFAPPLLPLAFSVILGWGLRG
jgi:hypothetical protein